MPPIPAGLGFPFHPKAEPQFRHPLTRPSDRQNLRAPICPCSGQFVMQNPALRISSGRTLLYLSGLVSRQALFEAASFARPGLSGTTCFHEQFNELFLQPSHASARHDMGLAHHLQAVGLLHSSVMAGLPFPGCSFPGIPMAHRLTLVTTPNGLL